MKKRWMSAGSGVVLFEQWQAIELVAFAVY